MKSITFFKLRNKEILFLSALMLCIGNVFGQVQQNATFYIGDNGLVSIFTNPFNFGVSPATTFTTRTATTYGRLYFSSGINWVDASNANHVDGYASTYGNSSFTFPIGDGAKLATASITNASTTLTYDSAYYSENPLTDFPGTVASSLSAISPVEYWDVKSTGSANLTLTWRADSNMSSFVPTMAEAVIAGYNSNTSTWELIDATATGDFTASVSSSVTSNAAVNFATYSKFTIASKSTCSPVVVSSGVIKIWDGSSWTPAGEPTIADPVIINGAYNGVSFECFSLQLNDDITLGEGKYIDVYGDVTGTKKIIMASSASFVQRLGGSAPNLQMTKTRTSLRKWDYVYYGTPIAGNFFQNFSTARAPGGPQYGLDIFYKYNSGLNGGWQATATTETGKGIIARVKQQAPFTTNTSVADLNVVFTGVANNGDVNVGPFNNSPTQNAGDGGHSRILLGNPYPSAIDGDRFLAENTDLDGVLYIWKAATLWPGYGLYAQADYITYTRAGFTSNDGTSGFNGKIPSGQGFKVRITPDATLPSSNMVTANVKFNNCMRILDNNTNFYRSSSSQNDIVVKDRFKLNMITSDGKYSQLLVAYLPESTNGYDRLYDAVEGSVSANKIYTYNENDSKKLSINARSSFENTDTVRLGLSKSNTNLESFTVSITQKEGVFNTQNVTVYLHDKINDTYHNFNNGDFTYSTTENEVNDRFEVVYQSSSLSNPDFQLSDASVVMSNNLLSVKSSENIKNIQVYDVTGRLVEKYDSIDTNIFSGSFNHNESIYIAKIYFDNGTSISKKLIHTKN